MKILKNILLALALVSFVSCDKNDEGNLWSDDWKDPVKEEPENPENQDPENPEDPSKPEEPAKKDAKARLVWIDAAANFGDYANSKANIAADMARIKETGFTGVIVEVRPTTGGLLFNSDVEKPLDKVDAWIPGAYVWLERTENFDYLQEFINVGKEVGLDVYAAINTMVGGKECPYGLGSNGPLFDGSISRDWASVVNTQDGLVNCMDMGSGTKFLNPANDEVVEYLLGILEDLAAYDVKGIILDRCRYDDNDLKSDFSEVSRKKFEE
jgi:uncharacterized lipoprotein YddW (UPF0748 family)